MFKSLNALLPNTFKQNIKTKIKLISQKMLKGNTITFSQSGEDVILRNYFNNKRNGFYVDIGAFHPVIVSNTYYLHSALNWTGINIDTRPGSMKLFDKYRKNDINLEIAVSDEDKELIYYFINETSAMNTFSKEFVEKNNLSSLIKREIKIKPQSLSNILDTHLPLRKNIDFMNIDAEGYDISVLRSNNWDKYRPEIILVEIQISENSSIESCNCSRYMCDAGYEIISILYQETQARNVMFKRLY